jgi:hypothetical protein
MTQQEPAAVLVARLEVQASVSDSRRGPAIELRNEGPHVAVVTAATISPEADEAVDELSPPEGGFPVTLVAGSSQTLHAPQPVDGSAIVQVVCHDGRGKQLDTFEVDIRDLA